MLEVGGRTVIARFRVHGDPKGQPRIRAFARKMGNGKSVARVYDPGTAEGWKGVVAMAAKPHIPAAPVQTPCCVSVVFLFARPKRLLRKSDPTERIPHTAKPDRDNLDKAVLDVLTQVGFFADDALVYDGRISKFYCAKDEAPGAEIEIEW